VYTAALAAIENEYVEPIDTLCASPKLCGSEALIYGSIDGMLHTLDPHSSFFSPSEFAQMRERQEGRYYGLGITIQAIDGDITAASVFEGSPAYKKGIRRGDVLANVEGEETKGWTVDQAMRKLRGPKGTEVGVGVRRRQRVEHRRDHQARLGALGRLPHVGDDQLGLPRLRQPGSDPAGVCGPVGAVRAQQDPLVRHPRRTFLA